MKYGQELASMMKSLIGGGDVNWRELVDEYLSFIDLKENTKKSYRVILESWVDYLKKHNIATPDRTDILNYKEIIMKRLSSATVQKHIVIFRGFYRHLKANGVYEDITYQVRGCKVETVYKRQSLSIEDSIRLIKRAKRRATTEIGKRDYALTVLFLTTGLRSIEAARANAEDIDFVYSEAILHIQGKGKDSKAEYVKLSKEAYAAIEDYLSTVDVEKVEKENDRTPLFLTKPKQGKQKRLSTKMIRAIIKELLVGIGYNSRAYSVHSLRHTFATISLQEGSTLQQTMEALRHKNIATTQIYSHMVEGMNSKTTKMVSDALFKKKEVRQ